MEKEVEEETKKIAKALAALLAVSSAANLNLKYLLFEGDAKFLQDSLNCPFLMIFAFIIHQKKKKGLR